MYRTSCEPDDCDCTMILYIVRDVELRSTRNRRKSVWNENSFATYIVENIRPNLKRKKQRSAGKASLVVRADSRDGVGRDDGASVIDVRTFVLTYMSSLSYRIFKFHNNDASFKSLKNSAANIISCSLCNDKTRIYCKRAHVSCIMSSMPFWPRSCRRFTPLALVSENI